MQQARARPLHISSMAISPDGTLLAAASERGYTLLWSIARPAHPTLLAALSDPSRDNSLFAAVTFAPGGSFLAESHEDGTTSLWSLSNPAAPARIVKIKSGYQDIRRHHPCGRKRRQPGPVEHP